MLAIFSNSTSTGESEMDTVSPQQLKLQVDSANEVSALLLRPPAARACYVVAHGPGARMTHPSMERAAPGRSVRGVATLRYQFPYMEKGSKRPALPAVAHATVRA